MSGNNCALFVDGNGKYCCRNKVCRIGADQELGITFTLANTGDVDLLVFPTGDTNDASAVYQTLSEGSTTVYDAGVYMLDLDCEAIDGLAAPAASADRMAACCHPVSSHVPVQDSQEILDKLQEQCDTLQEILCHTLKPTGLFVTTGALCDQPVFVDAKTGNCVAFDSTSKTYIGVDMGNIGQNPSGKSYLSRTLNVEVHAPEGGGDVGLDMAAVLALLDGATFPNGDAADDAANVYIHSLTATLAHLGDESAAGTSTTCDATFVDGESGQEVNLEPGGEWASGAAPCTDIPEFKASVADGSTVRLCITVSQEMDKSNNVVPK